MLDFFIILSLVPFAISQDKLQNIDYLSFGYDIYKGNPLNTWGGGDPGFQVFQIFQFSYSQGHTSLDGRYLIPDDTTVAQELSCLLDFTSSDVSGGQSYTNTLDNHVSGEIGAFSARFKASKDYESVQEQTSKYKELYTVSKGECKIYTCKISPVGYPPLSSDFITMINNLPETYDEDSYMDFLSNVGTHYIQQIHMGARFSTVTRLSEKGWTSLLKQKISVDLAAEYSAVGASGAADYRTSDEKEKAAQFDSAKEQTLTSTIGSKPVAGGSEKDWATQTFEQPMPLDVKIANISNLLDEKYFKNTTMNVDIKKIRANMDTALLNYCAYLLKTGAIMDCNNPSENNPIPILYNGCRLCADNCGGDFPIDSGSFPSVGGNPYTGFAANCDSPYRQIDWGHVLHLCCQDENDFWKGSCRMCLSCGGDYQYISGNAYFASFETLMQLYDDSCTGQLMQRNELRRNLCCNSFTVCTWCASCGSDYPEESGQLDKYVVEGITVLLGFNGRGPQCIGFLQTWDQQEVKLCCRTQGNVLS